VDQPPLQVYAQFLDEATYLCSVSSMYRDLGEHRQVRERRRLARHPARVRPELVATAPGQVYSWDITKLAGPVKGEHFDAYVMIDIYSRYIVGAVVHAHESGPLAVEMMKEIFGVHRIPQVVHADRGTSMTSKTVAALLSDLEVTMSHSRPKVSNDNPYSELCRPRDNGIMPRSGLCRPRDYADLSALSLVRWGAGPEVVGIIRGLPGRPGRCRGRGSGRVWWSVA
jgi:transposase InsO family protein